MGGAYSAPVKRTKFYTDVVESLSGLEGKVVAVTGTTSGTGHALARAAAAKKCEVIMLNQFTEQKSLWLDPLFPMCALVFFLC